MAILLPEARQQFFDLNGNPLVGGKVYTYLAGSLSTLQATWQDALATTPNTNPIILDARGEATIFWDGVYQIQVQDSLSNIIYTVDNVTGNDGATTRKITGASGTNAVVATGSPTLRRYTPGMLYRYTPFAANTSAVTINIDGLGFIGILKADGGVMSGGEFQGGVECFLMMNSAASNLILISDALSQGTFVGTLTGCTTVPTGTFSWTKRGDLVVLTAPVAGLSGVSNSTGMTVTGLPAAITPNVVVNGRIYVTNNGVASGCAWAMLAGSLSTISFFIEVIAATFVTAPAGGFTAAGTKGLQAESHFIFRLR